MMVAEHIILARRSKRGFRIVSHLFFWIVLFLSTYVLVKTSFDPYKDTPLGYLTPLRQTIGWAVFFYPLMYVVIPMVMKGKWALFFLAMGTLLFLYTTIDVLGEKLVFQYCEICRVEVANKNAAYLSVIDKSFIDNILFRGSNIGFFISLFSGLLLPISIKYAIDYYRSEKEKVQLELNFLKAQVNPHFLFNTLNNLYGLILHERIDQSAETVNRLSDFMRYSLENAGKKTISIAEEIKLIENYVALEQLRLNFTKVVFEVTTDDKIKNLPPLLLLPLLENAFKYNVDKRNTTIAIILTIKDDLLHFKIENTFLAHTTKNGIGGLGLSNLKKRLDLYFSDRYAYDVKIDEAIYTASLKIDLK
ncbi:sensor histidine kinase [Spongiimicrobium salis]|uniref:sensor histidine kinase n=1 Tax=Spongiimicrobium salis TaxID=1667022 RepID=UPI00374D290D